MAAPAYILGDYITLKEVYSRVEALCNQVEANKVGKAGIISMIKRYMLKVVTFGDGAFASHYLTSATLDVTNNEVDIGHDNLPGCRSIRSISASYDNIAAGNLPDGDLGVYEIVRDNDYFIRAQRNKEYEWARLAYILEGKRKIYLYHGANITAATDKVEIIYTRTPYIGWTAADVDASDGATAEYIDVKDFLVPYVETGAAVEALRQAGVRDLKDLPADFERIVEGLNQMIISENQIRKQQSADTLAS